MFDVQKAVVRLLKGCLFVDMGYELTEFLAERNQTIRDFRIEMMINIKQYEKESQCKK